LAKPGRLKGVVAWALLVFLLIWLPLFTASLVILLLLDRLLFPRLPMLAGWVGVVPA